MKTLPLVASLAAFVAFALIPSPAVAGSLCFAFSLLTIFAADYSRVIKPLAPKAELVSFTRTAVPARNCELAA